MVCEKCGNEIPDGSASCVCCISQAEQTAPAKKDKNKTILI